MYYWSTSVSPREWRVLADFYSSRADLIEAVFPVDPAFRGGRREFLGLPGVQVRSWEGVVGADWEAATLTIGPENVDAVRRWMVLPRPRTTNPWKYELSRQGNGVFAVDEYHVVYPNVGDQELATLVELGVDFSRWGRSAATDPTSGARDPSSDRELGEALSRLFRGPSE